jgi:hypothetical protein
MRPSPTGSRWLGLWMRDFVAVVFKKPQSEGRIHVEDASTGPYSGRIYSVSGSTGWAESVLVSFTNISKNIAMTVIPRAK